MRIIEKAQQSKYDIFLMNDQNIMFGYTSPPYGKTRRIEKFQSIHFDECPKKYLIDPFLLREYILFSPNNESSPEQ